MNTRTFPVVSAVAVILACVVLSAALGPSRDPAAAESPTIVVTKSVDADVVLYADDVRYTVTVENRSENGVWASMIDPLPERFSYRNGSTAGLREPQVQFEIEPFPEPPCPTPSAEDTLGVCPIAIIVIRETLDWSGFYLEPRSSLTIEFTARVLGGAGQTNFNSAIVRSHGVAVETGKTAPVYVCGDLDANHRVGASDAAAVRAQLGSKSPDLAFDLNEDGDVTGGDVKIAVECARLSRRAAR